MLKCVNANFLIFRQIFNNGSCRFNYTVRFISEMSLVTVFAGQVLSIIPVANLPLMMPSLRAE